MPAVSRHRDSELISQKSNIPHINLNNGLFDDISSWKIKIITRNEILVEKSEDTKKSIDLKEKLNDIYNSNYYIIGTSDFIKTMKTLLEENHIDKKNYLVDNFG